MALLTLTEFAELHGISNPSVYKKRGRIVTNTAGYVDTTHPINQLIAAKPPKKKIKEPEETALPYLKDVIDSLDGDEPSATVVVEKKPALGKSESAGKKKLPHTQISPEIQAQMALDREKKEIDLDVIRMKRDRMRGDVIPTDIVRQAFARIFSGLTVSMKQEIENFLIEISKKARLNANDIAELRGKLVVIINRSVDTAVDESRSSVNNIVSEYRKSA